MSSSRHFPDHDDEAAKVPQAEARTLNYVRPYLYPAQLKAIFNEARYAVIEASTKSGKTHGCIVWLAEQAFKGKPGQNFWWVAPVYSQAKIAFKRLKRGIPAEIVTANESELTLTFVNGATIWFKSGDTPDNLFGEDVYGAVVDEASRCKEEAWHALRSTLTATGGSCRIIGNIKGRRNWFHRMARRAEAGEPNMSYAKLTWRDAVAGGILTEAEVDDARRQLPERVFKELFEAEASSDEGNPFGYAAIHSNIATMSARQPVVWGWDLAKSVDWCVGIALDAEGMVCRLLRFQRPWQETIATIKELTGTCRALIDSTGAGDPILDALQAKGGRNYEGFVFSRASKQKLMEGLALAIQRRTIRYPDGVIVVELEAFEYEYTKNGVRYSAPDGIHDDCVCALALANHHNTVSVQRNRGAFTV